MIHAYAKAVDLCPYELDSYAELMKDAGLFRSESMAYVLLENGKVVSAEGPADPGAGRIEHSSGKARKGPMPVKHGTRIADPGALAERLHRETGVDRVMVADLDAVRELEAKFYTVPDPPAERFEFFALKREALARCKGVIQYPGPPPDRLFACFSYREIENYVRCFVPDNSSITAAVFRGNELCTGFIWEIEEHGISTWSNYERLKGHGIGKIRGLGHVKKIVKVINRACLPLSRGYFLERGAAIKVLKARDREKAFAAALRCREAVLYQE